MNIDINKDWIDKHLKFVIAQALEKHIDDITKGFLATLSKLDLSEYSVKNLKGLEYAMNLKYLNLSKNNIVDVSAIKYMRKLVELEISENRIENMKFVKELINLKSIFIDNNNISKIEALENLKHLTYLNISNNKISDVSYISTLSNKSLKVIATEQCIVLPQIDITYGDSFEFKSPIKWGDENLLGLDNIQISGDYSEFSTDKKPYLMYSMSTFNIKNILSDCIIKAEFYHEVLFSNSGILSGILIIPIKLKNSIDTKKKLEYKSKISGNINISNEALNRDIFRNKTVTLINSCGEKTSSTISERGEYEFLNLTRDRYTLLFPFFSDYKYTTPSLYVCMLEDNNNMEINSSLVKF